MPDIVLVANNFRRWAVASALSIAAMFALPVEATPAAFGKAADIIASHDNANLPFVIIDKANARAFAYHATGKLLGQSPVLLGLSSGDKAPADIGQRSAKQIGPADRITPAGRFIASLGQDFVQDLLWIDYSSGLSLHRVVKGGAQDRRYERLASESHLDNQITFGCVNVPAVFFDDIVAPLFAGTVGIVYILPTSLLPE